MSYLRRHTTAVNNDSTKYSRERESSSSSSPSSSTKDEKPVADTLIRNQETSHISMNNDLKSPCIQSDNIFQKVSCYSTHHPVWSSSIAFVSACILYYVFISRRRSAATARRWRPWVPRGSSMGDKTKGEYAAVSVYDELLDEFDKDDFSSCNGSNSDNSFDSDDEEETSRSKSNPKRRGIEMIPYDDGRLNLREVNG